MGLDQVKGLTAHTQTRILKNRPFHNLSDFLMRVDPHPKEAADLIQAGCFKGLGTIPGLLHQVQASRWAYGQYPLFDVEIQSQVPECELEARLEAQMDLLGAYVDAHPVELVTDQGQNLGTVNTLEALSHLGEEIKVLGIRQTTQRFYAHQGEPFYILELEDLEGVLPVMMTPTFYRRHRRAFSGQEPFIVEGRMEESPIYGQPVLQASKILEL
jgi:DNA polymerase III alpha subunit